MMVVAQIFGFIAIFLWILSVQQKTQVKILLVQFISNLFSALQYLSLKAYSGAFMFFVATFRCFLFYLKRKHGKEITKFWLFVFLLIIIIFGLLTYDGIISILPCITVMGYTIGNYLPNPKWIRRTFLIIPLVEIFYNYSVHAYIAIVGNIFVLISGFISLIRFKNSK